MIFIDLKGNFHQKNKLLKQDSGNLIMFFSTITNYNPPEEMTRQGSDLSKGKLLKNLGEAIVPGRLQMIFQLKNQLLIALYLNTRRTEVIGGREGREDLILLIMH